MKTAFAIAASLAATLAVAQPALPDGPGKALVESRCTTCHDLSSVTRSGYTRTEWLDNVHRMRNVGARISADELDTIVDYLARSLPERPRPAPVIVPGDARITIREWAVPTPGSRPHDPLLTPDGMLWYTGQFSNVLGRLDPKTGTFREFPLKSAHAGPHGLTADRDGNIWYTGNMGAHVGRLDPSSGEVKLVKSPTEKSRPYGILVNSKGVPFFVKFGANKVASIDPETMAIREWTLPNADARPRRLAITPDDAVWYADYARGSIGRLDPATGTVTEWPSPSGPKSQPYGMLSDGDVIWYSEAGTKPNTLVRFDPKTQKFQSWAIPSGGGVVRHMVRGADGRFGLALSGVNAVALVEKN